MPKTKKPSQSFSRSFQKKAKLNPWLVVIFVCLIAIVGLIVLRFSRADSGNTTITLKPTDINVRICSLDPSVQSLNVCAGDLADTANGKAWHTSVNQLGNFNWFGPYEKLTAWPDSTQKSVTACVTLRDNVPFGIQAQYVFDITANDGTKVLATRTVDGQSGAFKTSSNSLTIQCLSASLPATTYPADYQHVEYRVRVLRGSVDIFQMARTLTGTVTSSMIQPTASQQGMIWPVNTAVAQMRGPNNPGGSGCYGAIRNNSRHEGVDLIGTGGLNILNGNLYNDQIDVMAAQTGTVVNINQPNNDPGGYGNFVIIKHNDKLYTLYGHLSQIYVSVGQQVNQGQVIGRTGEAGNAGPIQAGFVHSGNQVHFQVQNTYTGSASVPFANTIDPSTQINQSINRNGC